MKQASNKLNRQNLLAFRHITVVVIAAFFRAAALLRTAALFGAAAFLRAAALFRAAAFVACPGNINKFAASKFTHKITPPL